MGLEPWDELRTALHVARAGTVSGAAATLRVHHATVIRHIDALEDRVSVKLFQRHAKGYTPTEAGHVLFATAAETEKRFEQLAARLQDMQEGISGQMIITTIPELSTLLLPAIAQMMHQFPTLRPCLRTEARVLRLEYGEAHVAIRAGGKPQEPDNVVQALGALCVALYASEDYLTRRSAPVSDAELRRHDFISSGDKDSRAPYVSWLTEHGGQVVLNSNDHATRLAAIKAGLGMGFLPVRLGQTEGLYQVMEPRTEWGTALWLVTHVDLHRSPKVQACAKLLRAYATVLTAPQT
jgi:DNA-binding transcriptional LysR family regulator